MAAKTVLVTGSRRNLGRAAALEFASQGANVVINGRERSDEADAVARECDRRGGRGVVVAADVSLAHDVAALVAATEEHFGPIDVYVHAVGHRIHRPFTEVDGTLWSNTIRTILDSAFHLASLILPGMMERGWGRVIHVAGGSAFTGQAGESAAAAAKAGVHGLTKSLAVEAGRHGVTVNTVSPGTFATVRDSGDPEMVRRLGEATPVGRMGLPEEFAGVCAFLASDAAAYITGQVIHVNGGRTMY